VHLLIRICGLAVVHWPLVGKCPVECCNCDYGLYWLTRMEQWWQSLIVRV